MSDAEKVRITVDLRAIEADIKDTKARIAAHDASIENLTLRRDRHVEYLGALRERKAVLTARKESK